MRDFDGLLQTLPLPHELKAFLRRVGIRQQLLQEHKSGTLQED
jgi:hypothetical protein